MPFDPAGGDLPVSSTDDVRAAWPGYVELTPAANAPVREALIAAEEAMFEAYQDASAYAAAQADPTRATGIYLDGHAEDRGLVQAPGEADDDFRARLFKPEATVTPAAIQAIADGILEGHTTKKCQVLESALDRLFLSDGTAVWHSFIGPVDPSYPDRLYDTRTQAHPGGPWLFADSLGRLFVLRVPVVDNVDAAHMFVLNGSVVEATPSPQGAWVANGTNQNGTEANGTVASFMAVSNATALELYQAIANSVTQHKGQGVRWELYADPNL